MITFLMCQDRICKDCVSEHLTLVIKEKNIHNLVCPVCGLPDIPEDAEATEYFNNLDIMVRPQQLVVLEYIRIITTELLLESRM